MLGCCCWCVWVGGWCISTIHWTFKNNMYPLLCCRSVAGRDERNALIEENKFHPQSISFSVVERNINHRFWGRQGTFDWMAVQRQHEMKEADFIKWRITPTTCSEIIEKFCLSPGTTCYFQFSHSFSIIAHMDVCHVIRWHSKIIKIRLIPVRERRNW